MTEKLHTLKDAAAILSCAPKTLENKASTFRKALERAGAIRYFGRIVRVTDSGLRAVARGESIAA